MPALVRAFLHALPAARPALVALSLASSLVACGDARPIAVEITPGKEEGALTIDPAVAEVSILAASVDGTSVTAAVAKPGEDFTLGDMPDTAIVTFELTGTDAAGNVVARGRSVSVAVGAVDTANGVLPLFIQRTGGFSRPPGDLARAHVHAPAGVLAERYLVAVGGDRAIGGSGDADPAIGDYFDMLLFAGADTGPKLERSAKSLVVVGTALLLIDDDGATFEDLDTGATTEATAPGALTFAEVSGGRSILSESEASFVVGATRPEVPTGGVLVVDASGSFSPAKLATPRAGAAAAWVPGVGLCVAGGSATGAGVECVREDLTTASLPFPADAVTGAAMVVTAEQQIALIGGRDAMGMPAPTRVLDLRCATECGQSPGTQLVPAADVVELAARGEAFALPSGGFLVVGESDAGETLVFRVAIGDGTVTALPLRDPRRGATPVPAPNGTLAIVGGEKTTSGPATSVELFFPE